MTDQNPQTVPAKKTYVKPSATKHTAASQVVGSVCTYVGYYYYYV
ncbi:MAG: hypothetical protein ABR906_04860 [Terracidiphilus sp.]|jgi:hypothetical protein